MFNRHSSPSTRLQESERKAMQHFLRDTTRTLRRVFGRVEEAHESKPLVRVTLDDGTSAANGKFLKVTNSPMDISLRFGKLRKGLKVVLMYTGEVEQNAVVEVIGFEDEPVLGYSQLTQNDIEKGLYEIFAPGSLPL